MFQFFFLIKSDLLDKCSREVFQIFFEDLFILIYIDSTPEVVSNPFWNYLALCLCHAVCPEFFFENMHYLVKLFYESYNFDNLQILTCITAKGSNLSLLYMMQCMLVLIFVFILKNCLAFYNIYIYSSLHALCNVCVWKW